jgi:superfamily II DNA/RNA helicase
MVVSEVDLAILEEKTVAQLKIELKTIGLPVSGTKAKLIERLIENNIEPEEILPAKDDEDKGWALDEEMDDSTTRAESTNMSSPTISKKGILELIPGPLLESLARRTNDNPSLLPVQERAFTPIASGSDAVIFAPTGSGKTLGYVLPLFARLLEWKQSGALKKRRRLSQQQLIRNRDPACPSILIIAPSRELAKQLGKVCSQFHPTSSGRVAAVFGGVPIERHASLLRKDLDVIVGTPGRIRELMREGHLSTSYVKTIVLDEADVLLNFDDQPEIEMLLDDMEEDYQLVLASATVNKRVRQFVKEVMEIDESDEGFVVVEGRGVDWSARTSATKGTATEPKSGRPAVSHWCTAARSSARSGLASDIVATLSPRVGIVFVASKIEADTVAEEMADRLTDVKVVLLHGDMSQSARSRTVAGLRETGGRPKILVATDVASRGLDLPGVDLVLQFGIPRRSGKDGTYDSELFTHRTGRAGRIGGGSIPADTILLYDPEEGEGRLLPELKDELNSVGIHIEPRPLPSPMEVMEASYSRARRVCSDVGGEGHFVSFFKDKIEAELEETPASNREQYLLDRLAAAMAALVGLGRAVPERSLLTADLRDRTLRVWSDESVSLSPPEVTKFVKGLGSGKIGRVMICSDGSAVFDLPTKRASRLLATAGKSNGVDLPLHVELPSKLPT